MARRKSSLSSAHRPSEISGTTFATRPSGTTIDKNAGIVTAADITTSKGLNATGGATIAKIDFGQGTQYKVYRGETGVSGAAGPTTRLSAGTIQINTGLTTVNTFVYSLQFKDATPGDTLYTTYGKNHLFNTGYAGGAGVTMTFYTNAGSAVTPGVSAGYTGVSVSWIAMGT